MSAPAADLKPLVRLEIHLPVATKLLNETRRMHWSALRKYRETLAWYVRVSMGTRKPPVPIEWARVTVDRYTTGKSPDTDNLYASCKDLLDVLVTPGRARFVKGALQFAHPHGIGIIHDDDPRHLELIVRSHQCPRGVKPHTVVTIEEIAEPTG